jgi:hypothetical protein
VNWVLYPLTARISSKVAENTIAEWRSLLLGLDPPLVAKELVLLLGQWLVALEHV